MSDYSSSVPRKRVWIACLSLFILVNIFTSSISSGNLKAIGEDDESIEQPIIDESISSDIEADFKPKANGNESVFACNQSVISKWNQEHYSDINDMEISGNRLYLVSDYKLAIYNIDEPDNPKFLTEITDPHLQTLVQLEVEGDLVYISAGTNRYNPVYLKIYNVSNIDAIELVCTYLTNFEFNAFTVQNKIIYYVSVDVEGVVVLNTTDFNDISEKIIVPDINTNYNYNFEITSNFLFILTASRYVSIFNITDINNVSLIGNIMPIDDIYGFNLENNLLFVHNDYNIAIVDITIITNPITVSVIELIEDLYYRVDYLVVANDILFLLTFYGDVLIYDISTLNVPILLDEYYPYGRWDFPIVNDNYLYHTNYGRGIYITNITIPTEIEVVRNILVEISEIAVEEGKIAMIIENMGILLLNASDPTTIEVAALIEEDGYLLEDVTIRNETLYYVVVDTLKIWDISNITNPILIEEASNVARGMQKLSNNLLFIGSDRLNIYNISSLTDISLLDFSSYTGTVIDIEFKDNSTIVSTRYDGIYYFNTSDPTEISLMDELSDGSYAYDENLAIDEDLLFVVTSYSGIRIFNISDNHFELLDIVNSFNFPSTIHSEDGLVFLNNANSDLAIVNFTIDEVTSLVNYTIIGTVNNYNFESLNYFNELIVDEELIYQVHANEGLVILGPDKDDDQLANYIEEEITGTDPTKKDSDSDNMSDEFEYTYGLNPLDGSDNETDIDLDGLSNVQECFYGSNPLLEDSDFDQL
ncbi:MAG: hypothetical protein ACTSSH_09435, partial [Candidatus Heimdallarchaeota archaeon]